MNDHPSLPPLPEVPMWLITREGKPMCARPTKNEALVYSYGFSKSEGIEIIEGVFIEAFREPVADHVVERNKMVGGEVVETLAERITYALLPDASEDTVRRVERMIREGEPAPARVGWQEIAAALAKELTDLLMSDYQTTRTPRPDLESPALASWREAQPPTSERANH